MKGLDPSSLGVRESERLRAAEVERRWAKLEDDPRERAPGDRGGVRERVGDRVRRVALEPGGASGSVDSASAASDESLVIGTRAALEAPPVCTGAVSLGERSLPERTPRVVVSVEIWEINASVPSWVGSAGQ